MKRAIFAAAASLLFTLAAPARALEAPYAPVPAEAAPAAPSALAAWIAGLRAAIARDGAGAVKAALAADFAVRECATDPLAPCPDGLPVAAYAPVDAADRTVDLLDAATAQANPALGGALCAPAAPRFDAAAAGAMIAAAGVAARDLRLARSPLVLRASPTRAAPPVTTLPAMSLVAEVSRTVATPPAGWLPVALPAGGIGWTSDLGLEPLVSDQVCFAPKPGGGYSIAALLLRGMP
ncbi:MAG: hypothetical protein KGI57_01885 [Hyphomicrobiales bacterium]|nr:hypothetical protein [Hyphomicrobiales bacterium]